MTHEPDRPLATAGLIDLARNAEVGEAGKDVMARLRCYVLDWLGVALLGSRTEASRIARRIVPPAHDEMCTVIGDGGQRATADHAALLNGLASHALDYDDGSGTGGLPHSSVTIMPTLLAIGELRDNNGAELLAAIVAGQEVGVRVTEMVEPEHYERGFHSLSTTGMFSAVAAGARLMGLSDDQWHSALAIAASSASGLRANFGTMTKPLHAGRAASSAVLACLLAEAGFTGAHDIIERRNGYVDVFAPVPRIERGTRAFGRPLVIEGTRFKYHASCTGTQSTIDAILTLRADNAFDAADVAEVRIGVHPTMLDVCDIVSPVSGLEAKFSIRFAAALALHGEDTSEAGFTDQRIRDERLQSTTRKVSVEALSGPRTNDDTEVTVRLTDGRQFVRRHNFADHRLSLAEEVRAVTEKFVRVTSDILSPSRADDVVAAVLDLDARMTIRQLLTLVGD